MDEEKKIDRQNMPDTEGVTVKSEEIISEKIETEEEKKIKNLISIAILLAGLFVGSLFIDVVQLIRGDGMSSRALNGTDVFNAAGKTWVAYDDPIVNVSVVTQESCESCNADEVVVFLRRVIPTMLAVKITENDPEYDKAISDFGVKTLPAIILSKEIDETNIYNQAPQIFEKIGDNYALNLAQLGIRAGKYLEIPSVDDNDIVIGSMDAPVKVVEYSDFQCPFCERFHPVVKQMLGTYSGDQVQYVYKHLPLNFHAQATNAALASECANEQDKFMEYADVLFDKQEEWGVTQGTQSFKAYARQIGLNAGSFNTCLDSQKYSAKVAEDMEEAAEFGVSGTPGTFINGQFVSGVTSFESLKAIIEEELAAK